jgi:two-component system sensor kinase
LQLSPLAADDVRRLAESMAGPLPDDAAQVLIRLAGGSPFMASAVLRGLVESGALSASASGWRIEPLALDRLQSSSHAASLLARRIELLPPATVSLLSVGAVLGKEFDLKIAAHLSQQAPSEAIDAADEARQRRLVWIGPDGGQCVFVHDKIRAALLDRLSPTERRDMHRRAAMHMQEEAAEQISDLAYHFDAAGDTQSALPYALQAAETARAQHSLEIADQQYRIAERGAEHADRATRFRIAEGLGDVLMLRGRYDAAASLFEQAASWADGVLANGHIYEKLAELSFKRGDKERATQGFEDALRRLGRFVPRSLPAFALLLVWETIVQVLHTAFPRVFVHRLKNAPSEEVRLQLRLFSRLAHSYWFTRGKVQTLWAHLRGMNLGECYPPTLELAHAYSEHAPAMSLVPLFRRACAYSLRSLEIRREFGDLWGQGQSLTFYGCVLYYSSRYHECIEKCREAIRLLERMGDYWYVHVARYQLAASLYHLGEFSAAIEEAQLNYKSGVELRDEQASGIILDVWARAASGSLPEGILEAERRRELQDAQGAAQILLAEGITLLGAGELRRAAEAFRQSIAVANRAGIQNAYTLPSLTWLATALRIMAERHDAVDPRGRRALLRRAARAARRAIGAARICANDLPQALREYALVSAMLGRRRRAYRAFHRALAIAHQHQARYEYAQTLLARGKVGRQLGWPLADRHVAEAEELLGELLPAPQPQESKDAAAEGPVTLSLADRFDTVLDAGRKIASALNKSGIYDEAQAAALRLLRGECCRVVEMESSDEQPHASPAGGDDDYDLRMISLAERNGRAVAFSEEFAEATSDRAGSSGEGSALCVPIQVRGRTAACLYVTHRHIAGVFGPDEERLADFIAAIAGAALENAEGFGQLQSLNATLEQRVADRTAAAESRARELALSNEELERVARELRAAEEQLRVAIDAAESANAAKTRFLTTMSHEIRTPMNGILGMTELSLQTPLSPQQRNFLTVIKQSGESLLALLNDVLDLSKIEAGRMDLETIPFRIHEIVNAAVRLLAVTASRKGVELICRVAPEVPEAILGDPTRLRQVIVNLVGNAVKFTSAGDVFVNVFVEGEDEERLHMAVQDSGIGIPPDKQNSIFQSFQQADSSTTRRYGGTGLGLAISSQLVSLMGGRIWVESEVGRGSTFHVVIPLRPAEESRRREHPLEGIHVLWLSEHPTNRGVFGEALASRGAMVTALGDTADALAAFEDERAASCYDVIVADLAGADSAAGKLIETASRRRFPAVVLLAAGQSCPTADGDTLNRLHAISKPASADELCEAVLAAVRDGDSAAQPQPAGDPADSLPPLRILLAEDGLVNQEVAVGLLEIAGHSVKVANNGREALESLDRGAFDLILMDLEMPEMDGFEATRRIRELESATGERIPIVAMTAHAVNGFRDRCLDAGMDGYITKPIELNELLRVMRELLRCSETLAACE